jgi:hypothetical protein
MKTKRSRTARLTPLQVKEAIVEWALRHGLVETHEVAFAFVNIEIQKNGSAVIDKTTVQA